MALTIIDNGDAGYSDTGAAWTLDNAAGYGGDHKYTTAGPPGSSSDLAEWNFTGLTGGSTYQVYYTWPNGGSRATNTPWKVYDSDGTTVLDSGTLDQTVPPDDITDSGANWELIAEVTISGTELTLELASGPADNYVIIDAAGVQELVVPENTTRASGNANDTATWGGGVVPDSADDVIIRTQDTLTINVDTTYNSMEINGNVTIAAGVTLTVLASCTQADGTLTLGVGSALELDATSADLIWTLGTANGQSNCRIIANGTANVGDDSAKPVATTGGNHARIFKTGSNEAYFKIGDTVGDGSGTYYTGCPGYNLNYCDVEDIFNAAGSVALPVSSNSNHNLIALFCNFDTCGQIFGPPTGGSGWLHAGNMDARFENNKIANTVTDDYGVYWYLGNDSGSGTTSFLRNGCDGRVRLNVPNGNVTGNYFDDCIHGESADTFTDNTIRYSSNAQVLAPPTDLVDTYLLSDNRAPGGVGNQHFCEVSQRNCNGAVFETVNHAIDYPDCWFGDLRAVAAVARRVENTLIIARPSDETAAGVLLNPGTGYVADWDVEVEHCTIVGNEACLLFLENSRASGIITSCKSNLIVSPSTSEGTGSRFVWDGIAGAENDDSIVASACTDNWLHNPETDPDRDSPFTERTGFVDHHLSSLPAGPTYTSTGAGYDGDGPQFVDPTRRAASYAVMKGWALSGDTETQKIDAWRAGLMADPREGPLCRDWVRAGYAPQNPLLEAAHDNVAPTNGWIGAVEGVTAGALTVPIAMYHYRHHVGA